METMSGRRKKSGKRTGRAAPALSKSERRRLAQLGVSLAIFALALVGRSVFPEQMEQWNEVLGRTTDFKAVFTEFGKATANGEPFSEAMGELLGEVFADGSNGMKGWTDKTEPRLTERGRTAEDTITSWRQGMESIEEKVKALDGQDGIEVEKTAASSGLDAHAPIRVEQLVAVTEETVAPPEGSKVRPEQELGLDDCTTPLRGTLTSRYGYRDHPVNGDYVFHRGVDVAADIGTPIVSFADGVVECIGESWESGIYIQIDHGGGIKTFYAHCSRLFAGQGEQVRMGQVIAAVGESGNATGPHLHFAVIKNGEYLDPLTYTQFDGI